MALLFLPVAALLGACENEKTKQANLYVTFEYSGEKIDTTTTEKDRIVFRNVDGGPAVVVPTYDGNVCEDKILLGTYSLYDTLEWHLRLVEPDPGPAHFNLYFNDDQQPVLLNESLYFGLPTPHNFSVRSETCGSNSIVVISE